MGCSPASGMTGSMGGKASCRAELCINRANASPVASFPSPPARARIAAVQSGEEAAMKMTLTVNGRPVAVTVDDPKMPLLYALRDELGLHGPRFGCGLAQCGACTVHVDGKAVRSCRTPLSSITAQ